MSESTLPPQVHAAIVRILRRFGPVDFYEFNRQLCFSCDYSHRQRLDHYGYDEEGWDEDLWEEEYAGPLRRRVDAAIDEHFGPNHPISVMIGEKGHIEVEVMKDRVHEL